MTTRVRVVQVMLEELPLVWLEPTESARLPRGGTLRTPVYVTQARHEAPGRAPPAHRQDQYDINRVSWKFGARVHKGHAFSARRRAASPACISQACLLLYLARSASSRTRCVLSWKALAVLRRC